MGATVDIIIPSYEPDQTLRLLLQRLQKQTFAVHKVIIINTEKEKWERFVKQYNMGDLLKQYANRMELFHIKKEEFDHGGSRRFGVEQSLADFFICMTQDAIPANSHLIEQLMMPFSDPQVSAVCARQIPAQDCNLVERFTRQFNYPAQDRIKTKADIKQLGIKTFFCSNVCSAYRRHSYDELGGFEPHAIFNEDMILAGHAVMAGQKIAYAAGARVIHSHNYSGWQQLQRNFDLAVSQKQHPEVFAQIKSESEGIRLVLKTINYLLLNKKPWLIADLIWKSACKFLGYRIGLNYHTIGKKNILRFTMNKSYWYQQWEVK
jgi:rhamnosyltransferase